MIQRHLASLLLVSLGTPACVGNDAVGPALPDVPAAGGCTTEVPDGQVVVGCGFGPGITPVAAADGRVYVVSSTGTYSAIDLTTATTTRLFRYQFSATAEQLALGTVAHDGRLYFPGNLLVDDGVRTALMSIDGSTVTPDDAPDVVAWGDAYELVAPMFGSGDRLYAESIIHEGFSAGSGPVVAIGYDGRGLRALTSEYAEPIGVAAGSLYYRHDNAVKRVPLEGGAAELIASELSSVNNGFDRAVDADHVYATTVAAPYELRRFGVGGASQLVLEVSRGDAELPQGAPHHLRRDGDWLYFMQNVGGVSDGYAALARVHADGSGELEPLAAGPQLTPPVFDEAALYVAYTRGGIDEPIEGVVVRIAK